MHRTSYTHLAAADQALLRAARGAQETAYARYSGFPVGAALLSADGRIFTGCNIENASYGLTICAERVALFTAIATGVRVFAAIAVVAGGADTEPSMPCGACRQVLAEFGPPFRVLLAGPGAAGPVLVTSVAELLPHPFTLDAIE